MRIILIIFIMFQFIIISQADTFNLEEYKLEQQKMRQAEDQYTNKITAPLEVTLRSRLIENLSEINEDLIKENIDFDGIEEETNDLVKDLIDYRERFISLLAGEKISFVRNGKKVELKITMDHQNIKPELSLCDKNPLHNAFLMHSNTSETDLVGEITFCVANMKYLFLSRFYEHVQEDNVDKLFALYFDQTLIHELVHVYQGSGECKAYLLEEQLTFFAFGEFYSQTSKFEEQNCQDPFSEHISLIYGESVNQHRIELSKYFEFY